MAKRKKKSQEIDPRNPPRKDFRMHRGIIAHLQMIAPITGDLIYSGANHKGEVVNLLVPNPDAQEHQREYFARLGRRG